MRDADLCFFVDVNAALKKAGVEDILDVGVSIQLRDIALQGRNESQALVWLMSEPVQEFLEQQKVQKILSKIMKIILQH